MPPNGFKSSISMTHIGTATAILSIDGVNLLMDPAFSGPAQYDLGFFIAECLQGPALALDRLPPIDAVLLSHEDHVDNLDELGRTLLNGRKVITTMDGLKNLKPRPGVSGVSPWQTVPLDVGGEHFEITGTPCKHLPGGECTGFIIQHPRFGTSLEGLPNAIYISGDTVYMEELVQMRQKFHISVAILNLGCAMVTDPTGAAEGLVTVTMDGTSAAKLFREIGADVLVPLHFESWAHFSENGSQLAEVFKKEGIYDKVAWLTPGIPKSII